MVVRRQMPLTWSSSCQKLYTASPRTATCQGLTLVHFSAQRERFLWDRGACRGCILGVFKRCQEGLGGAQGVFCQTQLKLS
jgi:hypothetical protein